MIQRYTRAEIGNIWTEQHRFETMLKVEIVACEAMVKEGKVPAADLAEVKKKARINVDEINEIEKTVKHDVIAFLTQVERTVGEAARHLHMGMTSSDVLDTATSIQLVEATVLLEGKLKTLINTTGALAKKHKRTLMMGRTHGVHAEPITFGIKAAGWYTELQRDAERLERAKEAIAYGKISGAVGTYAHLHPKIEKFICAKLGLKPEPVSTQVIPRDRHAEYMMTLAVTAATLERIALEIRHLQRSEVLEAEEPFSEGQRGSSAMPHKRNPIVCENICGLSRLIRGNAHAALENVALWHERDISHSSVERVILPDSTIALYYMLERLNGVLEGLNVYPEKMKENMKRTVLIVSSQRLMLKLMEKSKEKLPRERAYKIIQEMAQKAWTQNEDFEALVYKNPQVTKYLDKKTIQECFNSDYFIRHTDLIFKQAGL